ncbi:MAG: N-acetylmuramoyl-L-alanine amidase [Firmicutes bacterium]|nr:N-acetylmuramoyl-L-alanine amidase [Bacillota bacterium]
MATIVIDPGHGGTDPGAVRGTRHEANDNLNMALAVGRILESRGHRVIYTRRTDTNVSLAERARISNNANADIFVSIHRNAAVNPEAHGLENYVRPAATAREVENATRVLNRIADLNIFRNRGLHRGNFFVLNATNAPAMLLELGFISNAEDNRLFDANFSRIAEATAQGIIDSVAPVRPPVTPPTTPPPIAPPVTPPRPTPGGDATVRQIQTTLNNVYGQNLVVDGIAGPLTRRALTRALQMQLNSQFGSRLAVDGIFGPLTRAQIPLVRRGDRGNLVWILQAAMWINGFQTNPDGVFGPLTEQTVRNFQASRGIGTDGIAGPITFTELFRT